MSYLILEFFIGLIFLIGISYTVYKDAKSRREESALGWAIGTVLLLIVILPLYYFRVVRKKPIST